MVELFYLLQSLGFCTVQDFKDAFMLFHRAHLEASAEKWNRLLTSLEELIKWLNTKDEELKKQMPIGGDVPTLQQQYDHCKVSCITFIDMFPTVNNKMSQIEYRRNDEHLIPPSIEFLKKKHNALF